VTTCTTFANSIKNRVEAGRTLDDIAKELCTDVKFNREKVIRVIRDFLGEDYLIEHASTLEYNVQRAKLAKKRKHKKQEKIDAKGDNESKKSSDENQHAEIYFDDVVEKLMELIKLTSISTVKSAMERIEHESL
jgi:hypothetical protein